MNNKQAELPKYKVTILESIKADPLTLSHLAMMNIPAAWVDSKGAGVKVAVLDTGAPHHHDIQLAGFGNYTTCASARDHNGHSTHCCGVIRATQNNNIGICGVAPEVELYACKVLGDRGAGDVVSIVKGIKWATDVIKADVINMSLGISTRRPIRILKDACDYAKSKGVTIVCAAGNDAGAVNQPASYSSTIAVAAIDKHFKRASFSNMGPALDFCTGGTEILSCYLHNGYAKLQGTSMASPGIAGVAALIIAKHRNLGKELTPDEVKEHISRITLDLGRKGDDNLYGEGMPIFKDSAGSLVYAGKRVHFFTNMWRKIKDLFKSSKTF